MANEKRVTINEKDVSSQPNPYQNTPGIVNRNDPVAVTGTPPKGPATTFMTPVRNQKRVGSSKVGILAGEGGLMQTERKIALVKSKLPPGHLLNSNCDSTLRSQSDKGGTVNNVEPMPLDSGEDELKEDNEEQYDITDPGAEVEEEMEEFAYHMTRQVRNASRQPKPKPGVKVKGRSSRKPCGI